MAEKEIFIDGERMIGHSIELHHANLLLIKAKRGFLACGYINPASCEKFNDAAAIVTGVSTCEEMLSATVKTVSSAAALLGVAVGMSGRDALIKMN